MFFIFVCFIFPSLYYYFVLITKNTSFHIENFFYTLSILEQSKWLNSLESYTFSSMKPLQYTWTQIRSLSSDHASLQVIGDEVWVGTRELLLKKYDIHVFTKSGLWVRKFRTDFFVDRVILDDTGDLIAVSGSTGSINIINNTGQLIDNIYKTTDWFTDMSLWKGNLYVFSDKWYDDKWYTFTKINGRWLFLKSHDSDGYPNKFIIRDYRLFTLGKVYGYGEIYYGIYEYNLQGDRIQTYVRFHMYDNKDIVITGITHLCGVDKNKSFLIKSNNTPYLLTCTKDGKCSELSINITFNMLQDVVIDPQDNGLWILKNISKIESQLFRYTPKK